jgi:hypothetical protein
MKTLVKKQLLVKLFFIILFCVGIFSFKDYGISWDEPVQREIGKMNARYAFKKEPWLLTYKDKYYGPVFEVFLVGLEDAFHLTANPSSTYFMRHLANFLLFFLGVIFFYHLIQDRFKNWKISLLGCLFLILSPRIFAHSFYNSKDIPFLAMFIVSIYTLIKYIDKKDLKSAVIHALASAVLIDIRILGVIIPFFTFAFFFTDLLILKVSPTKLKKNTLSFLVYLFLLAILIILFWPILWTNPFHHFLQAFRQMSHYFWWGDILYLGSYFNASQLPWHYIPVWISITTPISYLILFLVGCLALFKKLIAHPIKFYRRHRNDLIFLLWFFVPLASVVVIKSVLYDAWRQMFFIYPALLLIALYGLTILAQKSIVKKILTLIIICNLIIIVKFMIQSHPRQYLYFNRLANPIDFQLDYWGLSYRQALEYLVATDPSPEIKIYTANDPGKINSCFLASLDVNRLTYVSHPAEAEYFLTNYRNRRDELEYYQNEYYSIKVDQTKILGIYQLN